MCSLCFPLQKLSMWALRVLAAYLNPNNTQHLILTPKSLSVSFSAKSIYSKTPSSLNWKITLQSIQFRECSAFPSPQGLEINISIILHLSIPFPSLLGAQHVREAVTRMHMLHKLAFQFLFLFLQHQKCGSLQNKSNQHSTKNIS